MVRRVAILLLNYNGSADTLECLAALAADGQNTADAQVYLLDNASTESDWQALSRGDLRGARVSRLEMNTGFTGGNNFAFEQALQDGPYRYTLLLNNDTIPPRGMVSALADYLDAHPNVGAVQPRLLLFDCHTIDNTGLLCDKFGATYPRGRGERSTTPFDDSTFFYASGACLMVRTELFKSVGRFDGELFAYHEDVDLSWQLRLMGWDIRCLDDIVCYHRGSAVLGHSPAKYALIWRNRLRVMTKNYEWYNVLKYVPATIVLIAAYATLKSIRNRRLDFLLGGLLATLWNVRKLPDTVRQRARIQRLRVRSDRAIAHYFSRGSFELAAVRDSLRSEQLNTSE